MKALLNLFIVLVILAGCSSPKKEKPSTQNSLQTELDTYLQAQAANQEFNGSVLITKGDSIVFHKNYGLAQRSFNVPINDSAKYLIGSITKPFTAMCILILEQQGQLSLDDKLSAYFPDFPRANEVRVRQLLNHTSGIRDYHDFPDWEALGKTDLEPIDVVNRIKDDPYRFDPGTSFRYSNTGYILLGLIIEKVTGQSFAEYLESAILDPLSLRNTGVITNTSVIPNLATGYVSSPRETMAPVYINYNQPFTSGNMYSNMNDLKVFTEAVVSSKLLPKDKTEEIFEAENSAYGYGWGIRDFDGVKAYGHNGGMNGYWSSITYIPESDCFMGVLSNEESTPVFTIVKDLVAIQYGKEYNMPLVNEYQWPTDSMINHVCGAYLVKPGDTLHVYAEDDRLYMKETGRAPFEIFCVGENRFAFILQEYTASFTANSLEFHGLIDLKAKRL